MLEFKSEECGRMASFNNGSLVKQNFHQDTTDNTFSYNTVNGAVA